MLPRVPVAQTPEAKFREYLSTRDRKQRFTAAQKDLVEFIFSKHRHFDAEELCDQIAKAKLNASRATVYRTLTKLVEAGLLRKIPLGARVVFDHDYGYPQHAHLHCERCNRMIEVTSDELDDLVSVLSSRHQFQLNTYNLVVHGTCSDCNRSRVTKRKLDLI